MPVASETGGGDFQLPPKGAHVARCIHVIDLGTQPDNWMGRPKNIRKVRFGWELPNEKAVFDEERGEEPFIVGADYTLSLNERANLRHMLESWRGKEFTADELKAFDLSKVLGKACMVNILHKDSTRNKGRTYAVVATVTPLPKGTTAPKCTLEKLSYDIEMGENDVFKKLPEWIQDKIKQSNEATGKGGEQFQPKGGGGDEGPDEDEIPF